MDDRIRKRRHQFIKEKGMTVIGPDEGLDIEAFKKNVWELEERFGEQYGEFYENIRMMN